MRKTMTTAATAAIMLAATAAFAGPTPADKCEASKNKTAGGYYSCREKAEAKAISKGLPAEYSKCTAKFDSKWDTAETKGAGACPDNVTLTADMNAFLAAQAADAASVIAGGPLPAVCGNSILEAGEDCEIGDLNGAACATQPGFLGGTLACAPGCTLDTSDCYTTRFEDLGATVLDRSTGLEWEKKDGADGSANLANPHDVDNAYQWSSTGTLADGSIFLDFLATLNGGTSGSAGAPTTGCFDERCDWRLPTKEELASILDCSGGAPCADPLLGPTKSSQYWTSTIGSAPYDATIAWMEFFNDGSIVPAIKVLSRYVRAVRGGA